MTEFTGRGIVGGVIEGEALVSRETISGFGGIDPASGTIIEPRHELFGVCFTDKVLVFPGAKGSSGWSGFFQSTRLMGTAPLAMVFNVMTTKAVLGAIVTRVPSVVECTPDPVAGIRTGDWVRVDGDRGVVTVVRRAGERDGTAVSLREECTGWEFSPNERDTGVSAGHRADSPKTPATVQASIRHRSQT